MFKLPTEYFVLDFETNGLPKGNDLSEVDFTEIAYVHCVDGKIVNEVAQLANPGKPQSAKIIELTGITDEMLKGCPSSLEVARVTFPTLNNSTIPIVGHNIVGFDRLFLDKYAVALGLKKIATERYIDTAAFFKTYRRAHRAKSSRFELPTDQKFCFDWTQNVLEKSWTEDAVKYNLDAAVGYLAIPQFGIATDRHRALYDVILTQRVLETLRREMEL